MFLLILIIFYPSDTSPKKLKKNTNNNKNNNNNINNSMELMPIERPEVGWGLGRGAPDSWTPPGLSAPLSRAFRLCVGRRIADEGESIGKRETGEGAG